MRKRPPGMRKTACGELPSLFSGPDFQWNSVLCAGSDSQRGPGGGAGDRCGQMHQKVAFKAIPIFCIMARDICGDVNSPEDHRDCMGLVFHAKKVHTNSCKKTARATPDVDAIVYGSPCSTIFLLYSFSGSRLTYGLTTEFTIRS